MRTLEVRFVRGMPPDLWLKPELPAGAAGAMVGWVRGFELVDSCVPEDVAKVIVSALTQTYRLTFLDPGEKGTSQWQDRGDRSVRFLAPGVAAKVLRSAGYALISTIDPAIAVRLFETDESLWSLQSQVVLLSRRDAPPPAVDFNSFDNLVRSRRLDCVQLRSGLGCAGTLTPGPDGDFAQLVLCDEGDMDRFVRTLRSQTENMGILFTEVSGPEFRQTKWFVEEVRR